MTAPPTATWLDDVHTGSPEVLLARLRERFENPYDAGPPLADRLGEEPEDVIVGLAQHDESFRRRLERALADFIDSEASAPTEQNAPLLDGVLEIVPRLALGGAFTPLRAWLERHHDAFALDPAERIGWRALGALLASQPAGLADGRDFWLHLWHTVPSPWQPRAFIGLRLHDAEAAVAEIPLLLERGKHEAPGPDALIVGLWGHPPSKTALLAWLKRNSGSGDAERVRAILRRHVPKDELRDIGPDPAPPRARPTLPSLAARKPAPWSVEWSNAA